MEEQIQESKKLGEDREILQNIHMQVACLVAQTYVGTLYGRRINERVGQ